jgi:hypothetical protein
MKVYGFDIPDNCSVSFHDQGIRVRVSLNVPEELQPFIPKESLAKGKEFCVFWVSQDIRWKECSKSLIEKSYHLLLNRVMQNVRVKKQELLERQIVKLKEVQKTLEFEI